MAAKARRSEQTVVLAIALALEIGLILAFFLGGDIEGLEARFSWKQLAVVSAALFFIYVLYVELRVKQYGQVIVAEKVRTHTVVESLNEPVLLLDGDDRVIAANAGACKALEVDPVAVIGRDFAGFFDEPTARKIREGFAGQTEAARAGSDRHCTLKLLPLKGQPGKIVAIEERREAAGDRPAGEREPSGLRPAFWEALRGMGQEVESMPDGARRRFAAAFIRGRKALGPEGRLGEAPPVRQDCDLEDLARRAVEDSLPLARAKKIRVEVSAEGQAKLKADAALVRRALEEVVFNACSYTPEGGGVQVAVRGDDASVSLSVTDSGVGIPPAEVGRVFEPGFVGSSQLPETGGGRGLGLALAKKIVLAHRGSIWAESQPGRGTRISLTLPRES